MVETRLSSAEQDDPFFFAVYASSRQQEMASWGWCDKDQLQFLRMQFQCQQQSYKQQYPHLENRIILSGNILAGRILIEKTTNEIILVDITLLPEFQNQGIGTHLLKKIQKKADAGIPVRLTVMDGNPARRLYERLGFKVTGCSELHTFMEWKR
ncbi:MAG: GNAT family N-acetyltransferase [Syntrophomonas sp.]